MVNPYPTGTYTPQEMPSFAWRAHPTLAVLAQAHKTLLLQKLVVGNKKTWGALPGCH